MKTKYHFLKNNFELYEYFEYFGNISDDVSYISNNYYKIIKVSKHLNLLLA